MSPKLKNQSFTLILFQILGTIILSYGICVTYFLHPISEHKFNHYWTFIITCFYFLAISIARPFSPGYLNPSASIGLCLGKLITKRYAVYCVASQIVGAILGTLIYYAFNKQPPSFYQNSPSFLNVLYDGIGEFFGSCIFIFSIIYAQKQKYVTGQPSKYFFVSLMYLIGRTYTCRKACINPVIAFSLQIFEAGLKRNFILFFSSFGIIIGSIIGGICGALFYHKFYQKLLIEIQQSSNK